MGFQDFREKIINPNSINFRTKSAIIYINQEDSLISIYWDSPTVTDDFKQGYQLAADLAKRFNTCHWLNDVRNLAYLNIEHQNWICRCIFPQLMQTKIQKMARVVLDDPLAIMVSYNMADKMTNNPSPPCHIEVEIFTNFDHALYWLNC